ncbi:ABC transporter substrate-binding protein [Desulfocurvus sp. DL9XJH121]
MKPTTILHRLGAILCALLMAAGMSVQAQAKTTLTIGYAYPAVFDKVQEQIINEFKKVEPDIEVTIQAKYQSYEDATKQVLRGAMTGNLPDVSFQGLSRVRLLSDKRIAQPLDAFIKGDKGMAAQGFTQAMYDTCTFKGKVYGLPFAVSQPIAYYNMDLAQKAGYTEDTLPRTWDELYAFARKVEKTSPGVSGMFYRWQITGFWLLQSLMFKDGGAFMDKAEKTVTLNTPVGYKSFATLRDMVVKGGMRKDYSWNDAQSAFSAGNLGMMITSCSTLQNIAKNIGGRFALKTFPVPGLHQGSKLPVGGNAAVMFAKDKEKQEAAWKFLKFWCGVQGAKVVGMETGYMAPNAKAKEALKGFLDSNPNVSQVYALQPYMTGWYAFPGKNGLKITELLYDAMEKAVTTDRDTRELCDEVNARIQKLVP